MGRLDDEGGFEGGHMGVFASIIRAIDTLPVHDTGKDWEAACRQAAFDKRTPCVLLRSKEPYKGQYYYQILIKSDFFDAPQVYAAFEPVYESN